MGSAIRSSSRAGNLQLIVAAVALGIVPSTRGDEPKGDRPKIISLSKGLDGKSVIFEVKFERPKDADALSGFYYGTSGRMGSFLAPQSVRQRIPELRSNPPWNCPCFLDLSRPCKGDPTTMNGEEHPEQTLDLQCYVFVGRCPAANSIVLTLDYPLQKGGRRECSVTLDLEHATEMTSTPSPRERFGKAQAEWFQFVGKQIEDVGGFCTFAAEQTRRMFGVKSEKGGPNSVRPWRNSEEELYNVTTGALAVQESLQLDRMTATDRDRGERNVATKSIPGVKTKSHPFDEMRGEKEPVFSPLAKLVPENFYYLRFGNIAKLVDFLDFADQWGTSLLRMADPVGTDYGLRERIHRQLCLPQTALTRILGPAVIKELVLIGSDPYVQEGSDVTVLFNVAHKDLFRAAVDAHFQQARKEVPQATFDSTNYQDVAIERLVDANRKVSCHRCWLDDVCVYGNSLEAVKRVIDARGGKVPTLADAPDFKYMRAVVFPLDSTKEDGFLYLSDSFIRRLAGPELRIGEKRRLEAITSLKMLSNAAMFHGFMNGPGIPTMEDMLAAGSLTRDDLFDPEGGGFSWDAERGIAHSATYGDLSFLKPLIEMQAESVTAKEREQYERFRDRYQQYWRQYFDPIGVRIKIDKTVRIETCILPLIDLSEYGRFKDLAGGKSIEVHPERFSANTLFRLTMKLHDGETKKQGVSFLSSITNTNAASDWLGDWFTFWVEDTDAFTRLIRRESGVRDEEAAGQRRRPEELDIFNASFVLGVHSKNQVSLAVFLVALRTFIQSTAPNTVVFNNLEPYQGVTIVQIAPDPRGGFGSMLGLDSTSQPTTGPGVSEVGPAVYYAAIEDGFYLSTQASALRHLIDRLRQPPSTSGPATPVKANVCMFVSPSAAKLVRPAVSFLLEQRAHEVAISNMTQVRLLGRSGLLERMGLDDVARNYLGYRLVCPNGGSYKYDSKSDEVVSSIYGPLSNPKHLDEPPEHSPLAALLDSLDSVLGSLRFTKEGVETSLEIRRR